MASLSTRLDSQAATAKRPQVVRLKKSKQVPLLQLERTHHWHLFLSHIWSTCVDSGSNTGP